MEQAPATRRYVLLDRDGTVIVDRHYLSDPRQVELLPGAGPALRRLQDAGLGLVVLTNQSGISRGMYQVQDMHRVNERMGQLLAEQGVQLAGIWFCPHGPQDGCSCRKPLTGMVADAVAQLGFDSGQSIVVGDKASDIQLGHALGATTVLVLTGYGREHLATRQVSADIVAEDLAQAADAILERIGVKTVDQHEQLLQADRELVERVLADPDRHFAELVEAYVGLLLSLLSRFEFSPEQREDLQQETWAKLIRDDFHVLRSWRSERGARLGTYLRRVMMNVVNDWRRGHQRHSRYVVESSITTGDGEQVDLLAEYEDDGPGPDEQTSEQQLLDLMRAGLAEGLAQGELIESEIRAYWLRTQEIASRQVGQQLHQAEAWVNKATHKVRSYLRGWLQAHGVTPE